VSRPSRARYERLQSYVSRALHLHTQSRAAASYEETQLFNAHQLIRDILDEPASFLDHTTRYAASVIMGITYGRPSPSQKADRDLELMYQSIFELGQALRPGAWLVDHIPWLKYLPLYGRILRKQHKEELALFTRQMQKVRDDMVRPLS